MDDNELDELYQQIILQHSKSPKSEYAMDPHTHRAEGYNPLCGDEVTVYVNLEEGKIAASSFEGQGCAISRASASIMTNLLDGLSPEQAHAKAKEIYEFLTSAEEPDLDFMEIGDLAALVGVRKFPARIKCATLAWHALEDALNGEDQ